MSPEILASTQVGFPLLSALIFLPALAAVAMLVMKNGPVFTIALAASALELALAVLAWVTHDPATASLQLAEKAGFYSLGIDGVSAMFLSATALLTLFAVLCSSKMLTNNVPGYLSALLFSEAALMGAFAATNLGLFWVFFAVEIIPAYFLIKGWGVGVQREDVARHFVMYMVVSILAVGLGLVLMATNVTGGTSFDLATIAENGINPGIQALIFFVLCVGFAIKAPLFPLHSWLPKVLEHGPLVGMSVLFVGIKLGAYCLIRFVIPLLPEATAEWYWLMASFGFFSLVYGALIALVQTNLRRLLAFASVSHMGVVTLGLFSLNVAGIEGGVLQALNLGITGAGLFLMASFLSSRLGTPDLEKMGGLQNHMPLMAFGFLIIALAAVGMPGTSGFNGEHMVLLGAFEKHWLMAICVAIGPVLAAGYFLRYYQRAFLGEASQSTGLKATDLNGSERLIVASLIGVILWIGLYTTPFLSTMRTSVQEITASYDADDKKHASHVSTSEATLLALEPHEFETENTIIGGSK